jgi:NAD(P)H-flavin reductase
MVRIVEKRQLTPITKLYRVEAPLIARAARAGQFVIVRVREGGERIPLTITDYDRESGLLTIVVQEVGATTRRLGRSSTWSGRWARRPTSRAAATSSAWAAVTGRRPCCA